MYRRSPTVRLWLAECAQFRAGVASRWLVCLGTTVLSLLRSCGAGLVTVALHGGRHWCSPVAGGTLFQVGVQSCRGVGVVRVVPVSGPPFPVVFGVCVVVPPVPRLLAACFPAVLVRCWYVLVCGFSLYFWCAVAALGNGLRDKVSFLFLSVIQLFLNPAASLFV